MTALPCHPEERRDRLRAIALAAAGGISVERVLLSRDRDSSLPPPLFELRRTGRSE
jgi:hypothetical protein